MDPATLLRALSVGMNVQAGYNKLNAGDLDPRINAAAAETAQSFNDLTGDHFYAAIRTDEVAEIFRVSDGQTAIEQFSTVLRREVASPDIEVINEGRAR